MPDLTLEDLPDIPADEYAAWRQNTFARQSDAAIGAIQFQAASEQSIQESLGRIGSWAPTPSNEPPASAMSMAPVVAATPAPAATTVRPPSETLFGAPQMETAPAVQAETQAYQWTPPPPSGVRQVQAFTDPTGTEPPAASMSTQAVTPGVQGFVSSLLPYARQVEAETGIPASLLLAIPANETGWGRFMSGNNLYGIKGSNHGRSFSSPTWEVVNGQRVNITDTFRGYDSPLQSMRDFAMFLWENPRYHGALQQWQETGDATQLLRGIHAAGYATDPQWSDKVLSLMGTVERAATAAAPQSERISGKPATGSLKDVSQFDQTLTTGEAAAACGPAAAARLASLYGNDIPLSEVVKAAREVGWSEQAGMAGVANQKRLLDRLGIPARLETDVNWSLIQQDARADNPVTLSTGGVKPDGGAARLSSGHYFTITGYDPETGKYRVGSSGTDLRGGGEWMSRGEIEQMAGQANGVLFVDNPASPQRSVAAPPPGSPADQFRQASTSVIDTIGSTLGGVKDAAVNTVSSWLGSAGDALGGAAGVLTGQDAAVQSANQQIGDVAPGLGTLGRTTQDPGGVLGTVLQQGNARQQGNVETLGKVWRGEPVDPLDVGRAVLDEGLPLVGMSDAGRFLPQAAKTAGRVASATQDASAAGRRIEPPPPTKVESALDDVLAIPGRDVPGPSQILGPRGEVLSTVASGRTGPFGRDALTAVSRTEAGAAALGEIDPATLERLPNLSKLGAGLEDVQASLVRTAQESPNLIDRYRRGTITHAELVNDLAPKLGMTAEDFLKSPVGKALNETELLVLRATVVQKTAELADLGERILAKGGVDALSATEKLEARTALLDAARLQAVGRGAAATAGRTLNQQKIVIERQMAQAITGGNEAVAAQRAAEAAAKKQAAAQQRIAALERARAERALSQAERKELAAQMRAEQAAQREAAAAQRRLEQADRVASRVAERQQQQAQKALEALGGKQVTDQVLEDFLKLQQSGDPLAVAKFVRGLSDPGWGRRASMLRYSSMLSSTATHLTNSLSNVLTLTQDLALKPLAAGVDAARVAAFGGERTRYLAETQPAFRGALEGLAAGWKEGLVVLREGIDPKTAGKLEQVHSGFAFGQTKAGQAIGARASGAVDLAVEMPLRALQAADNVLRGAARGAQVRALATRQAIREGYSGARRLERVDEILANLTDFPELVAEAERGAARVVLQESRKETQAIARARGMHPGMDAALQVAMPFVRTPFNIAAQGAGLTPAGFLGVFWSAGRAATAKDVAGKLAAQGEMADRAARALFGTAVLATAHQFGAHGFLTGPYPTSPTERSTLPPGWQPWSVRLPNADGTATYVSFQNLGPIGIPLAVAAITSEGARRGQDIDPVQAVGGVGKFMLDQTFMQGLNDIINVVTEPERYAERFVEGLAGQTVPYAALQRQMTRALGIANRDPKGALEAILAISPATAEQVPARLDSLGREVQPTQTGAAAFVSPFRFSQETPDPALATLREAGVNVPKAPKAFKSVPLTDEEQRTFTTLAGQRISDAVTKASKNAKFRAASPEQRQAELERLVRQAREEAGAELMKGIPVAERKRRITEATPAR